jgi:predicted amidohydrolase
MAEELKVALIQSFLVWEDPEQNRVNFTQLLNKVSEDTDLVILPEMFSTGFTMNPENLDALEGQKTMNWMKDMARDKGIALIGSVSYAENKIYTNRLFFVTEEGRMLHYDKRHTFTLAGEDKIYQAGAEKLIVEYKGFRLAPMICYDLRFPVWARNTEDYDALIYVANWPKLRIAAWDALLKARAIENLAYCIGVNRVGKDPNGHEYPGHSAVYDGLGTRLIFSKGEAILMAVLNKEHLESLRKQLNFLQDRDEFTLIP